jgi:hypothetical protein
MINYESAAVPKFAEQRVITVINNLEVLKFAKIESWKNKNIDGFYTKTTQEGGYSKIQQNQSIHM